MSRMGHNPHANASSPLLLNEGIMENGFVASPPPYSVHENGQAPTSFRILPDDSQVTSTPGSSEVEIVILAEKRINNIQASMHILKTAVGSGVLAMPKIVRNSGLLVGTVGIAVVSLLVIHACNILIHTTQYIRRQFSQSEDDSYNLDYAKVVEKAISLGPRWIRHHTWLAGVLQFCIISGQFGFLSVCTIFVAQNTQDVVQYFRPDFKMSIMIYKAIVYFLFLALVSVKSLHYMSFFSGVANIMGITSLTIAIVYSMANLQPVQEFPLATDFMAVPLMFGMVLYAFEVITVIIPLENQMKSRSDLPGCNGVLSMSLMIATGIYTALGFYGYLCFGDSVEDTIIYSMPMNHWYLMITKPLYVVAILLSYALQFYVLMQIVLDKLTPYLVGRQALELQMIDSSIRFAVVTWAFLFALSVPKIGLLISLIGASACSAMTFVFPPLAHSLVLWHRDQGMFDFSTKVVLAKNALLGLLGLIGMVIGSYMSISDLVNSWRS